VAGRRRVRGRNYNRRRGVIRGWDWNGNGGFERQNTRNRLHCGSSRYRALRAVRVRRGRGLPCVQGHNICVASKVTLMGKPIFFFFFLVNL
jgi:hypothetical protein